MIVITLSYHSRMLKYVVTLNISCLLFTEQSYMLNSFLSTVPAISPPNVSVTVLNTSALTVSWRPIEEILWQGLFLGYVVYFNHSGDDLHNTVSANTLELTITNLTAFTVYDVTVAGYTRKGLGPKSSIIGKRTHEESKKADCNDMTISVSMLHDLLVYLICTVQKLAFNS